MRAWSIVDVSRSRKRIEVGKFFERPLPNGAFARRPSSLHQRVTLAIFSLAFKNFGQRQGERKIYIFRVERESRRRKDEEKPVRVDKLHLEGRISRSPRVYF